MVYCSVSSETVRNAPYGLFYKVISNFLMFDFFSFFLSFGFLKEIGLDGKFTNPFFLAVLVRSGSYPVSQN